MAMARATARGPAAATERAFRLALEAADGYGLVLFIIGAYVAEQVALANRFVSADSWLVLLSGRAIHSGGLPHADHWTVLANGRTWVDQQWLAQVFLFRVQEIGGLRLAVLAGVLIALGSFVAAAVLAVRRGATPRPLTWVVLAALAPYGRSADNLRAQSLCYPLFLAVLWLLTRPRSRWTLLVFPLLVLWANLHGSVFLAAALVAGCGLLRRRQTPWYWTVAFVGGPWLSLLISPYAGDLPRYYRTLLVNPAFGRYVTEWKPMTLSLLDVPTYAIFAAILILTGTGRTGWQREERFILLGCSLASLLAVRNAVWLALAAIVLLTPAAARVVAPFEIAALARRMNRVIVAVAAIAVVAAVASTATKPADWYGASYPARAATVASAAAGADGRVFATEDFADWLLWTRPALAGRVAFDARLELLHADELKRIFAFEGAQLPVPALVSGYSVFVVPPDLVGVVRSASRIPLRVLDRETTVVVLASRSG